MYNLRDIATDATTYVSINLHTKCTWHAYTTDENRGFLLCKYPCNPFPISFTLLTNKQSYIDNYR